MGRKDPRMEQVISKLREAEVGRGLFHATIEAIVGSIKGAGKNSSGGEATPQAA